MRYTKAALPSPQLIARWRAKGLVIADIAAAERALTFVGYFRLWNRRFAYRPEVYAQAPHHFTDQQSFYCYAVVMRLCSRLIDVGNDWPIQLHDLFGTHPTIFPAALGFPANWHADPIWN